MPDDEPGRLGDIDQTVEFVPSTGSCVQERATTPPRGELLGGEGNGFEKEFHWIR